jgi:hypothetical protein
LGLTDFVVVVVVESNKELTSYNRLKYLEVSGQKLI